MTDDVLLQWLRHLLGHKIPHTVMLFLWLDTQAVQLATLPFDISLVKLMNALPCQCRTDSSPNSPSQINLFGMKCIGTTRYCHLQSYPQGFSSRFLKLSPPFFEDEGVLVVLGLTASSRR